MAEITCQKCGQTTAGFERSPFPGAIGARVLEGTCPDCWQQWLKRVSSSPGKNFRIVS